MEELHEYIIIITIFFSPVREKLYLSNIQIQESIALIETSIKQT